MNATTGYEYKLISGFSNKLEDLDQKINALTDEGWEIYQSTACPAGGFGFGLAMGSGFGGGGMMSAIILIMRRSNVNDNHQE